MAHQAYLSFWKQGRGNAVIEEKREEHNNNNSLIIMLLTPSH